MLQELKSAVRTVRTRHIPRDLLESQNNAQSSRSRRKSERSETDENAVQMVSHRHVSVSSANDTRCLNSSIGQAGNYSSSLDLIVAHSFPNQIESRQQLWLDYASMMVKL